MWAVGQNCHLAGPSPVSLPRQTPFAPTSLLGNMKWGGITGWVVATSQFSAPPRANARLGKMVWQSHCHHKVSCYQAVSLGFLWPLRVCSLPWNEWENGQRGQRRACLLSVNAWKAKTGSKCPWPPPSPHSLREAMLN